MLMSNPAWMQNLSGGDKNKEACVIKDDGVFVWNKIMDCDG